MAGAWQLDTNLIPMMFLRGLESGERSRARDDAARDLEIERARQDDARGRAALESQRTERATQAQAQAQQQTLASLIGPDFAALGPDLGVRLHEQQAKSQTDQAQRKTQAQYNLARALQANAGNPQVSAALRAQAQQMGIDLGGQRVQIEGEQPVAVPAGADELRGIEAVALVGGAKPDTEDRADPWAKPTNDLIEFYRSTGLDPRDPSNAKQVKMYLDRQTKARAPVTNVNMPGGGVGLTTAAATQQQGSVVQARLRLKQIDGIRDAIKGAGGYNAVTGLVVEGGAIPQLMTRAGVGTRADAEAIKKRARVVAAIGGFTNPIISELSGANVPEGEMARMTQSLPTIEDAGPELEAKLDAWENNLRIIDQFGVDYLVNGIRTGEIKLPGAADTRAEQDAADEYDRNNK